MIKKIFKIIMIMISSIIVILMIASQLLLNDVFAPFKLAKYILTYKYANYEINRECDKIEKENRDENTKKVKEWVRNVYGSVVSSVIEIEYKGRISGWAADSHYVISAPFVDDASVYVESETHNVHGGFNFAKSPKFQHLYSEWVKKQVGIEDENVELEFSGNYDKPYIEFDKITNLSEDYREIFENTHNLFLDVIDIKSLIGGNDDFINTFYDIKNNYYYKVRDLLGSPNKISLYVYFNDYRFIYNFPEEEIASIRKNNEKIEITSINK